MLMIIQFQVVMSIRLLLRFLLPGKSNAKNSIKLFNSKIIQANPDKFQVIFFFYVQYK